jgi:endonuclease YncB( thermonuclease family)
MQIKHILLRASLDRLLTVGILCFLTVGTVGAGVGSVMFLKHILERSAQAASPDAGIPKPVTNALNACAGDARNATLLRVIDGDTLDVDIFLGFDLTLHTHGRILGVNCPEIHGVTKPAGDKASAFTKAFLAPCNNKITIRDRGPDKYGRRLLLVDCAGKDLATELLKSGNAIPYNP